MACRHVNKRLVNYILDYDACMSEAYRSVVEPSEPDICVAYQCDNCGAVLDASQEADIEDLQRTDLPMADEAAWDDAVMARVKREQPDCSSAPTMQFLSRAIRR